VCRCIVKRGEIGIKMEEKEWKKGVARKIERNRKKEVED
jgi:hypothetical protein